MTKDTVIQDILAFVEDEEDKVVVLGLLDTLEEIVGDENYDAGYANGSEESDSFAYDDGKSDGYDEGYSDGYDAGLEEQPDEESLASFLANLEQVDRRRVADRADDIAASFYE
ncbi:hypothetical protein SEA_VIEENROSE_65 [Streptomyces phage VieEnRose]|nr:hypothetical protein SEA_VIEENROSE_65 [Streptomyces phage VieEnRose]